MTRLTTGKRGVLTAEYQAEVNRWCRALRIEPPRVLVRHRHGGTYRQHRKTIYVPPACARTTLIHETAHHLAGVMLGRRARHGATFRVALVAVAAVALGMPSAYPWASEYTNVARWAERHGLVKKGAGA